MKQKINGILLSLFVFFPVTVLAEGYVSVSPDSLTIEKGNSETFIITAYNVIGDVTIKSNDNNVASVDVNSWETGVIDEKQSKTGTITVTGNNVGTTTIILAIDAASFDEDDLSGQVKTITINVLEENTESDNDDKYKLSLYFDKDTNVYIKDTKINISPYIIEMKLNEQYNLDDYIAEKEGYTFIGWDDSELCDSPLKTGIFEINEDIELNACFETDKAITDDNDVAENPKTGGGKKLILIFFIVITCVVICIKLINNQKKVWGNN